jgi:chloramphenicol O-acetyltransferase type B
MTIQLIYSKFLKKMRGNAIRRSTIDRTSKVESGSTVYHSTIDRYSFCGYDCSILDGEIGAFCSIGNRVSIGGVAHPAAFVSTSPVFLSHKDSVQAKFAHHAFLPELKTRIGHDVWIGEGVFIKAGIQIGHGAIVGMGSVVTRDVPPYAIVAGNPARLIRMRFEEKVVAALLDMAWWDLPEAELRRVAVHFNDPEQMLRNEGRL